MENLIIIVLQLSILVLVITIAQMVYRISKRKSKNLKEEDLTINLYEFSNLAREYFDESYIHSSVQNSGISILLEGTIIFVLKFFTKEEICEFRELSPVFKMRRDYPEFEQMLNELKKELIKKVKEKMPHYKITHVNCLY